MMKRIAIAAMVAVVLSVSLAAQRPAAPAGPVKVTAIKAGKMIDPETGAVLANQVILVEGEKIKEVGPTVKIPAGAEVIDLSKLTVLPGFVDAHTHMGVTYKEVPENNQYYLTYIMEGSPLRAIQAASNGIQMLSSGFTVSGRKQAAAATRLPCRTTAPSCSGVAGWKMLTSRS